MRPLVALLLALLVPVVANAQAHEFLVYMATHTEPERYQDKSIGIFGKRFVGAPPMHFHPRAETPIIIAGTQDSGGGRAALFVGEDGHVKEVKLLEVSHAEMTEDLASFFKRCVFREFKENGKRLEFETEMILVFRPVKRPEDPLDYKTDPVPIDGENLHFDQPPFAISLPRPRYPLEMRRRGIEGEVVVEFTVRDDGRARQAKVIESPDREFHRSALAAIEGARFKPGVKEGRPVAVKMRVSLFYRLEPSKSK